MAALPTAAFKVRFASVSGVLRRTRGLQGRHRQDRGCLEESRADGAQARSPRGGLSSRPVPAGRAQFMPRLHREASPSPHQGLRTSASPHSNEVPPHQGRPVGCWGCPQASRARAVCSVASPTGSHRLRGSGGAGGIPRRRLTARQGLRYEAAPPGTSLSYTRPWLSGLSLTTGQLAVPSIVLYPRGLANFSPAGAKVPPRLWKCFFINSPPTISQKIPQNVSHEGVLYCN